MIALALCIWIPLQAETGNLLTEGIAAYDAMELDLAHTKLAAARKQTPTEERAEVELWLGVVELERGRDGAARRALRAALQADPALEVPSRLSPKVRALVEELRPAAQAVLSPPPRPKARVRHEARAADARAPQPAAALPVLIPTPAPVPAPAPFPVPAASLAAHADASPAAADSPSPDASTPPEEPIASSSSEEPGLAAPVSPFLMLAAGGGAVATICLGSAVALGVSAKVLEGQAQAATRAGDANDAYAQASGNALVANALFVTSAVGASAGVAGAVLWVWNGGAE